MENAPVKARLTALLQEGLEAETAFAAGLSASERTAAGSYEDWSPRDLLAHTTAWKRHLIGSLQSALKGEAPPAEEDFEAANRRTYAAHREMSLEEVLAEDEKAVNLLLGLLGQFSEEDLTSPERYAWRKGRPLYPVILSQVYSHPLTHLVDYAHQHSKADLANRILEQIIAATTGFENSTEAPGSAVYNLACVFAAVDRPQKAIEALAKALRLNPDLRAWSLEDPDLAPLHGHPDYEALYA